MEGSLRAPQSGTPRTVIQLIFLPALITFTVTVPRIIGELEHWSITWFNADPGGFLAIGSWISAMTKNQVIAFVVTVVACFGFLISGYPPVMDFVRPWAGQAIVDAVASFSFLTRFESLSKGVIDLRDLVYFGTLIAVFLFAAGVIVEQKKGK